MSHYFIYGLIDPRPERQGELRYVGQSSVGMKRPRRIHAAWCGNWQKHLRGLGLREEIWVIEEWDGTGDLKGWLDDTETFYVAYFRMIGADLTNLTNGGDGLCSPMPAEVRQKISATRKAGKYVSWTKTHGHTEEARKKISLAGVGRYQSPETREKRASKLRGRKRPPEVGQKISATKRARREQHEV